MAHTGNRRIDVWRSTAPRRRQWTAWLAVFTLLLQFAVPFGQALAFDPATDIEYQIICTANGVKQIPINADGAPVEAQDTVSCPFCFAYAAPALVQPVLIGGEFSKNAQSDVAFSHPAYIQRTSIWRGTPRPSRAPPLNV